MYRPKQQWSGEVGTFGEVQGTEMDLCVYYEASPAEPDVNWPGDFQLISAINDAGVNMIDLMTEYELEQLSLRVETQAFTDPFEEH